MEDARERTFGQSGPEILDGGGAFTTAKQRAINRFERRYLQALMTRVGGNISRAAREAELARHHLRELLRKHGLYVAPDSEAPPAESGE